MAPRWALAAVALAAAMGVVAVVAGAAGAATPSPPTPTPPAVGLVAASAAALLPPPSEEWELAPTTPPRPPAASINVTACTAAYAVSGDGPAFLCCVDPSLGYCGGRVELAAGGAVCTVDWRTFPAGPGQQCCFRPRPSSGGRAPVLTAGAVYGSGGPRAPFLDLTCTTYGECPKGAPRRPTAELEATPTETVTRCGSWASGSYRRCDVTVCVVEPSRMARLVTGPRLTRWSAPVPFCGGRTFGTVAQCCQYKKKWIERARCCRGCKVPGQRVSSFGCCVPGRRARPLFR